MKDRLFHLYSDKPEKQYEVLSEFKGKELEGKEYTPLFNYFLEKKRDGAFRVYCADFVTSDTGTGIVQCAPAFGEDDFTFCHKMKIIKKDEAIPCPVDETGRFTDKVPEWEGIHVKEADKLITKTLKDMGKLIKQEEFSHNIPFCWRSDTPLIYKAVSSWFIHVESLKDKLIEENKKVHWIPESVGSSRFHNWLETVRDWSVSRSRYWGTPLPIWKSENDEEVICVGSIEELEQLTGKKVLDLHRDSIDHLTIPSKHGNGELRRIDEVFDCWFESGSMPYAQTHYPFENQEIFSKSFPADFIAEGLDQTRGWFYTLLVLGVGLFGKSPYNNVVVNGIVLASDGKKMSKRLKNYPDPINVINKYGADALRLYLINSPVVRAEQLRFSETGVGGIVAEVLRPWYHGYRFFVQCAETYQTTNELFFNPNVETQSKNIMDKWILSSLHKLQLFVHQEMLAYRLYSVVSRLIGFIDNLTNWYLQFNRSRLKGSKGSTDWIDSLQTTFKVLITLTTLMAPFTPFMAELMYQNLKKGLKDKTLQSKSVHFIVNSVFPEEKTNEDIILQFEALKTIVNLGRLIRTRSNRPIKCPLKTLIVINNNEDSLRKVFEIQEYIKSVLNIEDLIVSTDEDAFNVGLKIGLNHRVLGKRLGKDMKLVMDFVKELSWEKCREVRLVGYLQVGKHRLEGNDYVLEIVEPIDSKYSCATENGFVCLMDVSVNEEQIQEHLSREIINRIQKLRKSADLIESDNVVVQYEIIENGNEANIQTIFNTKLEFLQLRSNSMIVHKKENSTNSFFSTKYQIKDAMIELAILQS